MGIRWEKGTSKTVNFPSIQTLLLVLLLVGAMTAIVWVSLVVQPNEPPQPPAPEPPVEGPAAWLSAWSTFWGAVAGGIGAIGTAGALLLGAWTFRRQVKDQHSAQAAGVSILVSSILNQPYIREVSIRNDSQLPIYDVRVTLLGDEGPKQKKDVPHIIRGRDGKSWQVPTLSVRRGGAHMEFTDSTGAMWRRDSAGKLTEVKA